MRPSRVVRPAGVVGLIAAAMLAWSGAARAEPAIRIATEGAYPPFNYAEGNEPAGFEVELARALCAAMKASCTIVLQDWDTMIPGLKENRFDAIMSSMEITRDRQTRIAFTRPYYRVPSALIGPKTAAIPPGRPDLAGRTVGTTAGSEFQRWLETTAKGATVRTFDKVDDANLDLLTGRLDYVLGDKLALQAFLATREGAMCCRFVADMPVDRGAGVGIGLRRTDKALLARFDSAIAQVMADGTYDRVRARYFPFDIR